MQASRQPATGSRPETPPLRSLYIYLTDECNQRCAHCWINPTIEGRSQREHPSVDSYRRFVDAAVPLGLGYVKVTGGEPLLREDVYPIIEHLTDRKIRAGIETNAMLVGATEADFLKKHKVDVGVSMDGASAEIHEQRRGLVGAFDRTWRALELLAERGVPLTIIVATSRSNRGEIPKVLELVRGLKSSGPVALKINPIMPVGRARALERDGETFSPADLQELAEWFSSDLRPRYSELGIDVILQLEVAFFSVDALMRGSGRTGAYHCGFLTLLSTLADGSITFCGLGYDAPSLIMGNIKDDYDLKDIWDNNECLINMRRTLHGALEGVCGRCLFRSSCLGGCRASALATAGSMAASPPSCQALYDAGMFPKTRLQPGSSPARASASQG